MILMLMMTFLQALSQMHLKDMPSTVHQILAVGTVSL
jgi:hypothetical protein